jgi:hypothetical protein
MLILKCEWIGHGVAESTPCHATSLRRSYLARRAQASQP